MSCSCFSLLAHAACLTDYDPPPVATLNLPESGAFALGEPVTLSFSEPIAPKSLRLGVWRPEFDAERTLMGDPVVGSCTLEQKSCGAMTMAPLNQGDQVIGVSVSFAKGAPMLDGQTYLLEVEPGLEDEQGRVSKQAKTYNFQYALPKGGSGSVPSGLYTLSAYVEEGSFKIPLNLVCDVNSVEGGDIYFACIKADPKDPEGTKASSDPADLVIAPGAKSTWTVYFKGTVSELETGQKSIETSVASFFVPIFGTSAAELVEGKLQLLATITDDQVSLAGSLLHKGGYIHSNIRRPRRPVTPAVQPGSAIFAGQKIPSPDQFPGYAGVCGDPCGNAAQGGGYCLPLDGFPDPGVCPK